MQFYRLFPAAPRFLDSRSWFVNDDIDDLHQSNFLFVSPNPRLVFDVLSLAEFATLNPPTLNRGLSWKNFSMKTPKKHQKNYLFLFWVETNFSKMAKNFATFRTCWTRSPFSAFKTKPSGGMIWHKFLVFNEWMYLYPNKTNHLFTKKKVFVYIRYYGTYYVNVGRFLLVTGGTKTGSFATLTLHIQTISKVQGKIIKLTLSKAQGFFNSHEKKWKKYLKKWRDRF